MQGTFANGKSEVGCLCGLLGSITDTRGRKTGYTYNADGDLTKVTFANGKTVAFTYDANGNIQNVESSDKLKSTLTYTNAFRLNKVTNTSTISGVEHGQVLAAATAAISETMFTFSSALTTIEDDRNNRQFYKVNGDGNVYEYYSEENGKVVKAEKYDYVPYEKDNVQSAKRSSLYIKAYSAFTSADFTGGDFVNTALDEYNNATTKTTNARALSDGTTQEAVVTYEYDDNHKCVKERAVVTIKEGTSVLKTYTQITAYNYNAFGSIVRKESYIEGEEYTTGKSIEETEYDEKGNAVRSYSYNSLDSSSKFYTESEYAENGQTLADYDETGENKAEYEYIPGTTIVRRVKYPNGSKFAYGHEVDDTVTAITQSTAEGEENSTQKRYTCGEVTELVSGNNVVRYAYDGKRRVTRVELNGTEEYETYSYTEGKTEDSVVSTNAKNETFTTVTDKKGQVLRIKYGDATQVSYTYDAYGNVLTVTDGVTGATESNTYNTLEQQTAYARGSYAESYSYDKYGKLATFVQGTRTYSYAYKNNAARDLDHITVEGVTVTPETDVPGRDKGKEISGPNGKIAGEYLYVLSQSG